MADTDEPRLTRRALLTTTVLGAGSALGLGARAAPLRAAHYSKHALFFVLGTSRPGDEASVYGAMQAQWERAARLFDPPLQRVQIPYEGSALPGYFLTARTSGGRRPTIILV